MQNGQTISNTATASGRLGKAGSVLGWIQASRTNGYQIAFQANTGNLYT